MALNLEYREHLCLFELRLHYSINQNLYNSGVRMNISSAGVGIIHKNCVGVGIVTKMTEVGIGKVCWNRNH